MLYERPRIRGLSSIKPGNVLTTIMGKTQSGQMKEKR